MKRIILPILCSIFFAVEGHSQLCADSSFHGIYTLADSLIPACEIQLKDGGRFQLLETFRTANNQPHNVLIRYNKHNQLAWQGKLEQSPDMERLAVSRALEHPDGKLIISGFATMKSTRERLFYLAALSEYGQLLWQKTVDFRDIVSVAGNFGHSNKINGPICTGRSDSLIFSFSVEGESTVGDKIAVLCTDQSGNIGWSKTIVVPTVAESWVNLVKARINGNTLWMYGGHTSIDYCPDAAPSLGYINRGKIMALAFDLNTHSITQQRSYCPPITTMMNASGYVPGYQHYGGLTDGSIFGQDVFFLNNGQIAVTCSRLRATRMPERKNWLFSVSYFDEHFNHLKSEMITAGDLLMQSANQSIALDQQGNKHMSFINHHTGMVYYAVCDNNNQFILQKKIKANLTAPLFSQFRYNISKGRFTSFEMFNTVNNATAIDYFEVNPSYADAECFGEDTAFLSIEPGNVSVAELRGNLTTRTSQLQAQQANVQNADVHIDRRVVCTDKNVCDSLRMTFTQPACVTADTFKITAKKNQFCQGSVLFYFDSSAVVYYHQPDDTTLFLKPRAGRFDGAIIAVSSSCPQLRDTITVNFSSLQRELNLGVDRMFCPGDTYRLNAGPQFNYYKWQDDSSDSIFIASEPGKYWVMTTDDCSVYYDTINLYLPNITLHAGVDTSICRLAALRLQATNGFSSYSWTSLLSGETLMGNNITVWPKESGIWVVRANVENCQMRDSMIVTIKQCGNKLYIPTAFTPNNDGLNDRFGAYIDGGLESYRLNIFNRWGELLFSATDSNRVWDGYWKGKLQPAGVYIWHCEYKFAGMSTQTEKGTVSLIR